ncbi:conjugal transfer protein TraF [Rhizobium sp. Root1203]|uniref:conjugative transfer signal peptidase TraF n=1 Tax=Rhizobium sp. Root1203 TaxID=1736427 RepID=UPI0007105715|nr:conjugative transfer signal peptidase TraF [Rhizobium sp. Root1203]KQV17074.1 conjugal transfer protein TraF [Rhizobium sp. Root1203]
MISPTHSVPRLVRQRQSAILLLGASGFAVLATAVAGLAGGLRINTTPSEPLGIWRVVSLDRSVQPGDIVFVCPPPTPQILEGKARGYLRSGSCPGGFGPLIKAVAAVGGQRVDIAAEVVVDGRKIEHSRLVGRDGQGRPLRPYRGGTVPADEVFLHSPFVGSWDSRYFGPVPVSGVLGLARPVLTYAP